MPSSPIRRILSASLPLYSDLAAFAAHALKPGGVMVVMNDAMQLPQVLERLNHPDLNWISEFDLQHQSGIDSVRGSTILDHSPSQVTPHLRQVGVQAQWGRQRNRVADLR